MIAMKKVFTLIIMFFAFLCHAEAQIIGATNRSGNTNPRKVSPEYRETGASLRISSGIPNYGLLAFNYQLTPSILVGAGSGVNFSEDWDWGIPIFGELELRTPRYKWSLFIDAKIGYEAVSEDVFFAAMVGFGYKNLSVGFGVSTYQIYFYDYDLQEYVTESGFDYILPMVSISYNLPLKNISKAFF